jgi:hypothetical protein
LTQPRDNSSECRDVKNKNGHGSGAHTPDEYYVLESSNPKIQSFDGAAMSFAEYLYQLAK